MFKKIFCLILILKLAQARYGYVPKFYGQDSVIIVDTDKMLTQNKNAGFKYANKIRMPPPFPLWRNYPRYHIIPPPPPGQILPINTWSEAAKAKPGSIFSATSTTSTSTTTTTTSTTTPKPTISSTTFYSPLLADNEYPAELLDVAQTKLGLKSLEEIPSISELGQLLGTNSAEETLKYIKHLTSSEQGIALMKAYIESTDYTDNTADPDNKNYDLENEQEDEDEFDDFEDPLKVNDEGLIVITDEDSNDDYELNNEKEQTGDNPKTSKNMPKLLKEPKTIQNTELSEDKPSFMERVANYMNLNNLFHKTEVDDENKEYQQFNRITENGKKVSNKKESPPKEFLENQTESEIAKDLEAKSNNLKTPILITESIPYNYPVPIRIQTSTTASTSSSSSNTSLVHLNTPKILIPHVQQISRVTKIPSKHIEDFLAGKPKLLELATKVSRFPIGHDRNSPIEAQVLAAVQKAFEQDEDLKKLLSSTATLK